MHHAKPVAEARAHVYGEVEPVYIGLYRHVSAYQSGPVAEARAHVYGQVQPAPSSKHTSSIRQAYVSIRQASRRARRSMARSSLFI
jgi:hypothetical protein